MDTNNSAVTAWSGIGTRWRKVKGRKIEDIYNTLNNKDNK